MEEADVLCDRVALMHRGVLQTVGTPTELKTGLGPSATLEDVFRHYAGSDLSGAEDDGQSLQQVRATRRTVRRVG
jgi:ABC-2 type transport system ATP-binding protein